MSLTSYRAAPPRVTSYAKQKRRRELGLDGGDFNIVNGFAFHRQQSLATTYSSTA